MIEMMVLLDKNFKAGVRNIHKDLKENRNIINIFSHYMGCLFTLLIISFHAQKFVTLIGSNLFYSYLLTCLGPYLGIHSQIHGHEDLSLCSLVKVLWFYLLYLGH